MNQGKVRKYSADGLQDPEHKHRADSFSFICVFHVCVSLCESHTYPLRAASISNNHNSP